MVVLHIYKRILFLEGFDHFSFLQLLKKKEKKRSTIKKNKK